MSMKVINLERFKKSKISFYLALEEYVLSSKKFTDDVFFLWDIDKSIIIGKNQLIYSEVNEQYATKMGINIYRRPSGGGAIYADDGCFMFSFIIKNKVVNKEQTFKTYLTTIINALNKINIKAYFSGRNDLLVDGKKFSGNAYYKNINGEVLHGTFMYNTSIEEMVKCITPDSSKLLSKGIASVSSRVTNICEYTTLSKEELMIYLMNSINNEFMDLSKIDITKIKEIESKYLAREWIYLNNPPYTFKNMKRFSWGKVEVFIVIKKDKVKNIDIKGDFFELKDLKEILNSLKNVSFTRNKFKEILDKQNINEYILNGVNEDLLDLIFEEEKSDV